MQVNGLLVNYEKYGTISINDASPYHVNMSKVEKSKAK